MTFALWRDRLVLILLALLPLQTRYIKEPAALYGVPWEQGTVSIFVLEVLVLAALGCHLLASATRCEPKKEGPPLWLQLSGIIPVYAFISVAWAYDTIGALFSAIHLFEGYALAYLLWVSGVKLTKALWALMIGAVATSALGLWQYFTQTSFASTWLGLAAHPVSEAGTAVVETAGGRFLRAYGSLPHPNVLGGFAAAGLVAAFALATEARRPRIALLTAIVILSAGLTASFSRSAWLAAAAALAVALMFPRATSGWTLWRRMFPAVFAALAGFAMIAALSWPLLTARLTAQGRLESMSMDERVTDDLRGLEMDRIFLATGTGIGNYLPSLFLETGRTKNPFDIRPPHAVPLLVGAELGFFGLAVLAGFVVLWWFGAVWLMRRTGSPLVAVTATLPIVILVAACFDHYPFDLFAGTMLTGALFGLSLKAGEQGDGL